MICKLLPYIEQGNLYNALNFETQGDSNTPLWFEAAVNPATGRRYYEDVLPSLLCPSKAHDDYIGTTRASCSYAPSMGSQWFDSSGCDSLFWPTNNNNPFGTGGDNHGNSHDGVGMSGIISRFKWSAKLSDITDGTANTIMMGEILGPFSDHQRNGWMHFNALHSGTQGRN